MDAATTIPIASRQCCPYFVTIDTEIDAQHSERHLLVAVVAWSCSVLVLLRFYYLSNSLGLSLPAFATFPLMLSEVECTPQC